MVFVVAFESERFCEEPPMRTKLGEILSVTAVLAGVLQLTPAFAQSYGTDGPSFAGRSDAASGVPAYTPPYTPPAGAPQYSPPPESLFVPSGMALSATLSTSISTDVAKPGDLVQATLSQPVILSTGQLPAGTTLIGRVANASAGGFLGRSGHLTVNFDRLRTPNGTEAPMSAHITGELGKYKQSGNGNFQGEGAGAKVGQALMRTAIGAGAGAALGTAVGAIAGHGNNTVGYAPVYQPYGATVVPVGYAPSYSNGAARGAGRGAWSGAAIGGGVGLADSLLIRKGKNIEISSGTPVKLQLDAPITIGSQPQFGRM